MTEVAKLDIPVPAEAITRTGNVEKMEDLTHRQASECVGLLISLGTLRHSLLLCYVLLFYPFRMAFIRKTAGDWIYSVFVIIFFRSPQ
jgi:hypothetical protein